ncbi:MAG: TetR/AcrR family transcriptional regulator, partial [Acidimicrobiia bacterium]|nr:TetR/AcrR family transcriptional regulator [Acidimicrobiia bacterium]
MSELTGRHPTADALLDAVDSILGSEAASGLSLRQVEAEAGATHGSVRYHFGSLEGLLAAAFSRQNYEMVKRQ